MMSKGKCEGRLRRTPPLWEAAPLQTLFSAEVQENLRLYENYNGRKKIIISGAEFSNSFKAGAELSSGLG